MSVHSDMSLLLCAALPDKALVAAATRVDKALTRAHALLEELADSNCGEGCMGDWAPHAAARLLYEWDAA